MGKMVFGAIVTIITLALRIFGVLKIEKSLPEWAFKNWKRFYPENGRHEATNKSQKWLSIRLWLLFMLTLSMWCIMPWLSRENLIMWFLIPLGIVNSVLLLILWRFRGDYDKIAERLKNSPKLDGEIKSIQLIEDVLATEGEGEPFKIGWLYAKDIEFTVRRKEVDELKKLFKKHSALLLEGPSASGKTVIAKQFGLEMAKKAISSITPT